MTVQKLFIIIAILSALITAFRHYKKNSDGLFVNFFQYFVGMLFIFSGFVKAIDPLGTSYKMHEYFEKFSEEGLATFWSFMSEYSLAISIIMIVLEIVLGAMILLGHKSRIATIGLLSMNLFFLFLTGYSYLSGFCLTKQVVFVSAFLLLLVFLSSFIQDNKKRFQGLTIAVILVLLYFVFCKMSPNCATCVFDKTKMKVTDCGCFGDFMKLHPWETFYKDIFLTFVSVFLVRFHHKISDVLISKKSQIIILVGFVLSLAFCLYNSFWNEPPVDFRPYAVGSDINEKMKEIKPRISEFVFIYKNTNTGEQKEFATADIPNDPIWTFVDRKENIKDEGIPAPIHNLRFSDMEGNDVTTSLLTEENISYWIVVYNSKKSNTAYFEKEIIPLAQELRKQGVNVYCLTGNSTKEFDATALESMDVVKADETALKTMIRSNPGIMKIQNGKVLDKWHYHQFNKSKLGL